MNMIMCGTCLAVPLALATTTVHSQTARDSGTVATRTTRYLEPMVRAGALSGVVLLARNDTVIYHAAFGWADRPGGRPMTVSTPIAVASIAKPVTGIVIATLAEQGKLALSDPLARWLPDFPSADRITIELLMSHRAGVRHRVTVAEEERQPRTAESMVPLIAAQPLLFEPGSRRVYSSMGYVVLARLLELASGKPYWQLLDEIVLRPAGTTASFDATHRGSLTPAAAYFVGGDGPITRPPRDLSFLVAAGSLYSTPADLYAVFKRLKDGGYPSAARARSMPAGTVFWNGLTDGYRAYLQHDSAGVTLVFATNFVTGAGDMILRDLPRIARGEDVVSPALPRPGVVAMSRDAMRRASGRYEFQPGLLTPLEFASPRSAFAGDYLLLPISDSTFFSVPDYAEVKVTRNPDGTVSGLQWGAGGPSFPKRQ